MRKPLFTTPVLLLGFNRPDSMRRVLDVVRKVAPTRLFIAVDGPRVGRVGDIELCQAVRNVADEVDWTCEVRTLFRDENLGCRRAVSTAIDWFFEHEAEGIILEDDCIPSDDFFPFAAELLDRYRNDDRVMTIAGSYFGPTDIHIDCSYYFSERLHIWGWATWRDAWRHYDHEFEGWCQVRRTDWLSQRATQHPDFVDYWTSAFDDVVRGLVDSWAYIWLFTMWKYGGVTAVPTQNLVTNIGFSRRALHTRNLESPLNAIPLGKMDWPMDHPTSVVVDDRADAWEDAHILLVPRPPLVRALKKFPPVHRAVRRIQKALIGRWRA